MPDQVIHLRLPADADLVHVVVAAVGAAVRGTGRGPDAVAEARERAERKFHLCVDAGWAAVEVTIRASRDGYSVEWRPADP